MIVDEGEKGLEESLHDLFDVELRTHQEKTNVGEELPHRADSLMGQAAVRLLEGDVSVILRLSRQDLKGVWGMKQRQFTTTAATLKFQLSQVKTYLCSTFRNNCG